MRGCIVEAMAPHELIRALVTAEGGALQVAKKMRHRGFQPTLNKICNGLVTAPTHASAQRIATHFKIPLQAIYDPTVADQVFTERFGTRAAETTSPFRVRASKMRLSAEAETFARWYDAMTPEEQHRARLMMWVVKPGVNPTHIPAPGPGHHDEPDSGLSNLDPPASGPVKP